MKATKEVETNTTNNWIPRGWQRAKKLEEGWKPKKEPRKNKK